MTITNKKDVIDFLVKFKRLIKEKKFYIAEDRKKNREALIKLCLTKSLRTDCLLNLTDLDYCEGPLPDDSGSGDIWIFGLEIDGKEIYIKLKIDNYQNNEYAKCLSFHIAEFKLKYPYK